MEKKERIRTVVISMCVAFLLTTVYYITPIGRFSLLKLSSYVGNTDYSKLARMEYIIDKEFMGDADKEKMIDRANFGFVNGLDDDYSVYLDEYTYRTMTEAMERSYRGIGITAGIKEDKIYIRNVTAGSPAAEAGLLQGDYIIGVNGKSYTKDDYSEVINTIKATENGKSVVLEIKRGEEVFEKEIFVGEISRGYISEQMLESGIGYIRVKTFGTQISADFESAVEKLQGEGMTSLIIDLRSNPGGALDEVVSMTDLLMGEGIITTVKSGSGEVEEYTSDEKGIDIPICVLINSESASASELMAAALGDNAKATLVGEKTFGKGVVQAIYELGDGSAMRLTIAKYYTPSGECIDGEGVAPHEEVLMPDGLPIAEDKILTKEDVQIEKAKEILLK